MKSRSRKIKVFKNNEIGCIAIPKVKGKITKVAIKENYLYLKYDTNNIKKMQLTDSDLLVLKGNSLFYEYSRDEKYILNRLIIRFKK